MTENGGVHMPGLRRPLLPVRPLRPVDKKRPGGEGKDRGEKKDPGEKRKNDGEKGVEGIDIMA